MTHSLRALRFTRRRKRKRGGRGGGGRRNSSSLNQDRIERGSSCPTKSLGKYSTFKDLKRKRLRDGRRSYAKFLEIAYFLNVIFVGWKVRMVRRRYKKLSLSLFSFFCCRASTHGEGRRREGGRGGNGCVF